MATDNSNRLVFYSIPGQLQELVCVTIASYLWYCDRKNEYYGTKTTIQLSQLPTLIQNMVYEHVDAVSRKLNHWCTFNSYLFMESESENANRCDFELVDLISWSADGAINYRQTARKLLQSDKLSGKQKYRVACVYCFPEDIETLVAEKHEHSHPLVQYWNCRMGDEANCRLIAESTEYSSLEVSLLLNYKADDTWITLSAFQFFWEYLTDDERMKIIIERCPFFKKFLSYALGNLEERQLDCAMESNAAQILIILFHQTENIFMQLWNHVKTRNIITVSSFHEIILGLVKEFAYKAAFDIWISASVELREGILNNQNADILLKHLLGVSRTKCIPEFSGETRLMMELLSAYPSEKRETIWNEQWHYIIIGTPLERLQMVMKLCLGCDDKIISFKKMYMCGEYSKIRYYLNEMIIQRCFQELCMFLTFVTNNTEIIYDLRIRLMKSECFLENYFKAWRSQRAEGAAPFDKFIIETFSDANQLEDFLTYSMISDTPSSECFTSWLTEGIFEVDITGFYGHVLSSMPHLLNQAKNALLKHSLYALMCTAPILFTYWEKTVKWCLNDDVNLLKKFKRSVCVSYIFNVWMKKCMRELRRWKPDKDGVFHNTSFEVLQMLLRWFLEDNDKIRDFKLNKFNFSGFDKEIKLLRKSNKKPHINVLLEWFFHNDDYVNVHYTDYFETSLFNECVD